jgi:8-oxo-dGTP pyrophosphatase MutT (NUDIX family)
MKKPKMILFDYGHTLLHEPGFAAVKREIWEETGRECEIIGELGQIIENRSEHDFTQERSYYMARIVGEKGGLQ